MWKARLTAVTEKGIEVQYYETITGETKDERYRFKQFDIEGLTNAQIRQLLKSFVQANLADMNDNQTKLDSFNTALSSVLNQDL